MKIECVKKMNALTVNTLVTGFSFFYAILIEHYDHTASVIQCSDRLFGAKLRIFLNYYDFAVFCKTTNM